MQLLLLVNSLYLEIPTCILAHKVADIQHDKPNDELVAQTDEYGVEVVA